MATTSFNGVAIPSFLKVTGISFPVLPDISVKESAMPRRYGNYDGGVNFGGKTIVLDVLILKDPALTLMAQSDVLAKWLKGDNWKPSKLILAEQPDKFFNARASNSVEISDLFFSGEGSIEFYAADPAKYNAAETVKAFTNVTGLNLTIAYNGSVKTLPKITVSLADTGALKVATVNDYIRIENLTTGKKMTLYGVLNRSDLVLNSSNRNLSLASVPKVLAGLSLDSQWLDLQTGNNNLKVTTSVVGYSPYIKEVRYREAN